MSRLLQVKKKCYPFFNITFRHNSLLKPSVDNTVASASTTTNSTATATAAVAAAAAAKVVLEENENAETDEDVIKNQKLVEEFQYLLEKSQSLFSGLR